MSSPQKLSVFITGAASGLARGIARALAADGHEIAFTYRPEGTPPDATLRDIRDIGGSASAFPIDFLDDESSVSAALEQIAQSRRIDALVHAVGPMIVRRFERSSLEDYRAMLDGNLRSAVQAAMAVLPGMRQRRFGRLIFFALNGAEVTRPARGLALHAAAKSGLVAFAKCLSLEEAAHGITVNVVAPGDIREKQRLRETARGIKAANPVGRPGTWEDVADAVRFFLRPEADFINGAVLDVGGGLVEPYERNADGS